MVKSYLVTVLLAAMVLYPAIKGMSIKKEAVMMASQLTMRQDNPAAGASKDATAVTSADLIRAKENIEAYALANNVPVKVKASGTDITISSAPVANAAETTGQNAPQPTRTEPLTEDKAATLSHFYDDETGKGLLNFLGMVSDMKYKLSYKSLCIGVDCNAGIEIVLSSDSKAKPGGNVAPAPAAKPGATPPAPAKAG